MKRNIIFFIIFITSVIIGYRCSPFFPQRMLFIGDSITYGTGSGNGQCFTQIISGRIYTFCSGYTIENNSYFSLVKNTLYSVNYEFINIGCGRSSSSDWSLYAVEVDCAITERRLYDILAVPNLNSMIVYIMLGTEDAINLVSEESYRFNIHILLNELNEKTFRIVLLTPVQNYSSSVNVQLKLQAYRDILLEICDNPASNFDYTQISCIDTYSLLTQNDFSNGEKYPNAAGHAKIANAILTNLL